MRASNESQKAGIKPPYAAFGGRVSALHIAVISLSLLMTIGAYMFSKNQMKTRSEGRFELATDQVVALLEVRMEKYEDALWAGVAAIAAKGGDTTKQEWRIFAESLRLPEKYPGINGIGVIHFVEDSALDGYLTARTAEMDGFRIYPEHDQELRMPISFIEPEATNAAAVGLDVAHERNRRIAALASRDTATAQITGPIVLVQDKTSTPGFLFYAPFYEGGMPSAETDRSERAIGAVYAPFVVRKLMEGLLAKELRDIRFSIRDEGEMIYDEHSEDDPLADPQPMYQTNRQVALNGRIWDLDIETNLEFRNVNTFVQPYVVLLGGLLIEALIIALLVLMSRANLKARTFADQVTNELLIEKEKLTRSNEDLEQFVYILSHDLKTPIRGIGGLTEILKEDLREYLSSSTANPDISKNLDRIFDCASQLDSLGDGVLELTSIGRFEVPDEPLFLGSMIQSIAQDLNLPAESITLDSDVDRVSCDPFYFRRVLKSLIGNAKKYHRNLGGLQIKVAIYRQGNRLSVSVSDNGPGIDPKFHERIFQIFQTLGGHGANNSTGIGLTIVKKSIEKNGGQISLQSEIGKGCNFMFDWPFEDSYGYEHFEREAA